VVTFPSFFAGQKIIDGKPDDGTMRCQFTDFSSLCPRLRSPIAATPQPSQLDKSRFRLRQRITRLKCDALSKPDFRFRVPPWLGTCKTQQHPLHAMATFSIGSPDHLLPYTGHQTSSPSHSFQPSMHIGPMQAVLARIQRPWP